MDLLLLAPYDIHNPLPTLFEVFALDELQGALRNALGVGLFNVIDRAIVHVSPQVAHLQPYLPEIELILAVLIEGQFLHRFDATTTQRLFNLKLTNAIPKSPVISLLQKNASTAAHATTTTAVGGNSRSFIAHQPAQTDPRLPQSVSGISFGPLRKRQKALMLLEAALVPYLTRRLDQLHSDWTDDTPEGRDRRQQMERVMAPMQLKIVKGLARIYPILKAVLGIAKVAVWLSYMSNRIPYPSISMMIAKVIMTRRTIGDEALQKMSASSNRLFMFLSLAITWTIVGFEVADWWYRDGGRSSVLRERKGLPPPPPCLSNTTTTTENSASHVEASSTSSSAATSSSNVVEAGLCPICTNAVVNPCVNITSGYVFCYPCLAGYVREHGTCPVKTHMRTTARHIRRLFIE